MILDALEKITPWTTNCLAKACVATRKLQQWQIPYQLFLGLSKEKNELSAHAWTVVNGRFVVTGMTDFDRYTVTAIYHSEGNEKEVGKKNEASW